MKEFIKESHHLNQLKKLHEKLANSIKKRIERDIHFIKKGIQGEANVAYELAHSLQPMVCLYDIRLDYVGYQIQVDYIIITKKSIILLETKKLNGDIEITRDGAFIRIFKNKYGKVLKKEGMYSPISQNERHVRILEKILKQEKLMKRMPVKSYVVLANPKTIIHKNNCPKHIQENIYRYDQVTNLIKKELQDRSNKLDVREKYLFEIANFLKENHQPKIYDYERIYSIEKHDYLNGSVKESKNQIKTRNQAQSSIQTKVQFTTQAQTHTQSSQTKSSDEKLRELLRAYRLELSHKEGLKAFMIFTNKEMEELIANRPQSKAELLKLKGFGEKKVAKYGDGIIEIVRGE